jgi:hypothetical protein
MTKRCDVCGGWLHERANGTTYSALSFLCDPCRKRQESARERMPHETATTDENISARIPPQNRSYPFDL